MFVTVRQALSASIPLSQYMYWKGKDRVLKMAFFILYKNEFLKMAEKFTQNSVFKICYSQP